MPPATTTSACTASNGAGGNHGEQPEPEGVFPPSYSEATGQHASLGGGLTFVDFLPKCLSSGGVFSQPAFEPFRYLVYRANEWLREHPEWEVKTCESVEFKTNSEVINTERMTYFEFGEQSTRYVRSLRMWLVPRMDTSRPPQQIDYSDLIPQQTGHAGLFGMPTFESLHQVLERYNFNSRSKPPPGRVITVETQEMKIPTYSSFDPDRTYWCEHGGRSKHYVFLVRVFFELQPGGYGIPEEIGVADFVPQSLSSGGLFSTPQFEAFSSVVDRSSTWCSQQIALRFCNAQSIEIKLKSGRAVVDTQRMCYTEHAERSTFYVRILRIAYAKSPRSTAPLEGLPPPCGPLSPPLQLRCKTFVPAQLTRGFLVPEFESLSATKRRVEAWISATGARVLSSETVAMRLYTGGEAQPGVESSFSYNASRNEYWIYVIRVYLDGVYHEPPSEMLPDLPNVQEVGCCAIQ
ncbi:hypothetical protein BIW11_09036 [Tropilaelaps mercedesae]|uniref:Uncharacterized protein n=1 Tax=Tropilaelaps mercedesae TaxID=418985 RepID=A0A1V9XM47_9ACAR|nr:hypothetical protein BIW11_09036 [Tropilaelaps mercedesae]